MPRCIDADKLMEAIKAHHYPLVVKGLNSTDYGMFTLGIQQVVDEQPTVDVRHGYWIFEEFPDGYYHWECSECEKWFQEDSMSIDEEWGYCPNCGAKMDKVVK